MNQSNILQLDTNKIITEIFYIILLHLRSLKTVEKMYIFVLSEFYCDNPQIIAIKYYDTQVDLSKKCTFKKFSMFYTRSRISQFTVIFFFGKPVIIFQFFGKPVNSLSLLLRSEKTLCTFNLGFTCYLPVLSYRYCNFTCTIYPVIYK
jgi:hypothetical protein